MRKPSQRKSQMISSGGGLRGNLEQLNFPAVAVPNLADVNDRHVHDPENGEDDCVGVTGENHQRKAEASPSKDRQ
jgi:hypothetical protein